MGFSYLERTMKQLYVGGNYEREKVLHVLVNNPINMLLCYNLMQM